jgi:small-conductance mechanosensitive channel
MNKLNIHSNLFLLILILLSYQIVAQENYITDEGDTIKIIAYKPSEVFSKIELANQQIESLRTKLKPDSKILKIDSTALSAIEFLSSEEKKITDSTTFSSPREVNDQQMIWINYYSDLKNWQEPITARSQLLMNKIESINIDNRIWESTRKLAKEQNVSNEMLSSIDATINEYRKILKELKQQQDHIFSLQNQITEMLIRVDAVISQLEIEKQDKRRQYFVPEALPIWASSDSTSVRQDYKAEILKSIAKNRDLVANFFPPNINAVYIQLLIFLALLLFFLFIKKRIKAHKAYGNDKTETAYILITKYFILSSFLLSFISTLWLYHGAPLVFREILQMAVLIPTFILLSAIIDTKFKPYIYTILIIFLIDEFYFLVENIIYIARFLLILISIVLIWLNFKFTNLKGVIRPSLQGKFWKNIIQLSYLVTFVVIISIIAAIFGYISISALLTRTVIDAYFMGVLLYLFVLIISSIIQSTFSIGLLNGLNVVKKQPEKIQTWLISITRFLGVFLWFRSILISVGAFGYFLGWISNFLESKWEVGSITISPGAFIGFFIAIIFTYIIFKFIRILLEDELFPRVKLPRGVPGAISMIVGYFIVAVGIYIAISAAGVDLSEFGLVAGALGVGIGFGLQNIVFNFISGLVLAFERPVQVGDTVEVGTLLGSIKSIGVRSSTIKTYDGSEVIVPNGNLISNEVVNWTLSDRKRRRMIPVSVAYGSDPREVLALIYKAAEDHPEVLKKPAPWALFDGFGESSLNFSIYFWVSYDRGLSIQSEIAMAIYDALAIAQINIPFPQQDLHIKTIERDIAEKLMQKPERKKKTILKKPKKEEL